MALPVDLRSQRLACSSPTHLTFKLKCRTCEDSLRRFYASINVGAIIASTVIVNVQTNVSYWRGCWRGSPLLCGAARPPLSLLSLWREAAE